MNTTASAENYSLLLSFDVEDWFQVENFRTVISRDSWNARDLRVQENTHTILDILDRFDFQPKATFFILGWVARKVPEMVREIAARGHEVASHGFHHDVMDTLDRKALLQDLTSSKHLLEDITGRAVNGYRAPNFSISCSALALVRDAGYGYDASYNSFSGHGRYGRLDLSGSQSAYGVVEVADGFFEVPVSNLTLGGRVLPLGGGGYFRILPLPLFRQGIKAVLKQHNTFVFYAHPWEFDPAQPRVKNAAAGLRFRHYVNLSRTGDKLAAMIRHFSTCRFTSISTHLDALARS